jgi:Domain of unknown function (DUF4160)
LDIPSTASGVYAAAVPEISRFLGVSVTMYYDDHEPPHFHVRYGEHRAIIDIETMRLVDGWFASASVWSLDRMGITISHPTERELASST